MNCKSLIFCVSNLIRIAAMTGFLWTQFDQVIAEDSVRHTVFTGSLIKAGDDDGDILRRFEVQLLSNNRDHFFHVIDDPRQGCPWPESFGRIGPAINADAVQPHLVYNYDGHGYVIGLPPLVISFPDNIAVDTTWELRGWQMTVLESRNVDNSPAWIIESRERRGRQQKLTVHASTGVVLRADADVFMGQGDPFQLTLTRTSEKSLDPAVSESCIKTEAELLALQSILKRRPDSHLSELSARQIADSHSAMEQLVRLSSGTPLDLLIKQIKSDIDQQQTRLASVADRVNKLVNSEAPEFDLSLMSGGVLKSSELKGKTVILHFWDYRDSPLSEPYGQTGYLEYLYNQKRKMNVAVIGVSTNPDLQNAENVNRGRRSARKLSEFMNLSYPVGHDNGTLLKSLGDPRDSRGQLPLWVVINSDGKIAHYHAGFYEVDAAQGLKDLESVLAGLIR